jgi:heme-degrading monooxygenase HmoA
MKNPLHPMPVGALAVIFISELSPDQAGYSKMAERMAALAEAQEGFLGWATVRDGQGLGITVSWWSDRVAALEWKQVAEHQMAQRLGSERWYSRWSLQVCTIDESRGFTREQG